MRLGGLRICIICLLRTLALSNPLPIWSSRELNYWVHLWIGRVIWSSSSSSALSTDKTVLEYINKYILLNSATIPGTQTDIKSKCFLDTDCTCIRFMLESLGYFPAPSPGNIEVPLVIHLQGLYVNVERVHKSCYLIGFGEFARLILESIHFANIYTFIHNATLADLSYNK